MMSSTVWFWFQYWHMRLSQWWLFTEHRSHSHVTLCWWLGTSGTRRKWHHNYLLPRIGWTCWHCARHSLNTWLRRRSCHNFHDVCARAIHCYRLTNRGIRSLLTHNDNFLSWGLNTRGGGGAGDRDYPSRKPGWRRGTRDWSSTSWLLNHYLFLKKKRKIWATSWENLSSGFSIR